MRVAKEKHNLQFCVIGNLNKSINIYQHLFVQLPVVINLPKYINKQMAVGLG